eukprot:Seg1329.7 transcript_id=Seg1329.7/GoldUCD/mRNA.D3Y31 product="hypothetical protein" protein_id=Seg1329.7/GoldUCD/D3Y31
MARFTFLLCLVAVLVFNVMADFEEEEKDKRFILGTVLGLKSKVSGVKDRIKDRILGKRCNDDADCGAGQCCVPRHILGKRCRNLLDAGDYCATGFFGAALDRVVRRCPCQSGLTCQNTRTIAGLYKVYKCQ